MTGVLVDQGSLDRDTHSRKVTYGCKEKKTIYKSRREARNRSFLHSPQKTLILPTS